MKLYIHTWRYGIETTLAFHCRDADFSPVTQLLTLHAHVGHSIETDKEAVSAVIPNTLLFVGENDILNVAECDPTCDYKHQPVEFDIFS